MGASCLRLDEKGYKVFVNAAMKLQRDASLIALEVGALTLIGLLTLQRNIAIGLTMIAVQMTAIKFSGWLFSLWA